MIDDHGMAGFTDFIHRVTSNAASVGWSVDYQTGTSFFVQYFVEKLISIFTPCQYDE